MKKILTAAQLTSYRRLKDRSVRVTFDTSEKNSSEIAYIDSLIDTFGYLMFKSEEQLTQAEIAEIDKLDTEMGERKTQSQRLRGVLYRVWEQSPGREFEDFKTFYKNETEKIISHYKKKL